MRQLAKECVIVHSDQIPFLGKVRPGKQLYAEFEVQGKHWKAERAQNKKALDQAIHANEGPCLKQLPGDQEDEGKQQISSDGMAHLRGEATDNNDKYRITVDCEQVFYNVCDSTKPVKAGWGVVSVTMTGAHCDLSNVSQDRRWIRDQAFNYNGKEVLYKAGEKLHPMHAKALLDSRDQHPELWQRMRDVNIEIYLQPAGFEDGIITKWKIEKQGQRFAVSIGVRDLFGGGLAETTKLAQQAINQIATNITGKMGCALQITDTDVAMRLKNKSAKELQDLRLELHKLAQAEGTRAIFRCGTYEVLRALTGAIEKLRAEMDKENAMLKAGRRNGWLNIRPCLSSGKFISCSSEEWAQGMPEGSHRMRKDWTEDRMTWLNEEGMPKPISAEEWDKNFEEEQTYLTTENAERELSTWRALLQDGELTQTELDQMKAEPWFELEIQEFKDHAEVHKGYLDLIKTPKQLRQEAGVDEYLTTQRRKDHHAKLRANHKRFRAALRPARQQAVERMKAMSAGGASQAAILRQIIPQIGPKASKAPLMPCSKQKVKDKLRGAMGKFMAGQVKKRQKKQAEADEGKEDETKKVRNN